ncbi:type IV pilus twitching motility protein PilT [Paucidesulfovibrio longus]|uniref:type IV pilus twitching motility protein PilT n=1 Tax=Paucidesulfovibrio longus TaxID=889 RepID=UPI0003B4DAA2|nr:PilT/PilU family type 4a pilus ATPase [Paucidesulfovibrio longus]
MRPEQFNAMAAAVLKRHPRLSDILFTVGASVQAEVDGELVPVRVRGLETLTPENTRAVAECVLGDHLVHRRALAERGSCDLSHALSSEARFRVNVFKQRGNLAVVMRRLPQVIPGMADLGLPPVFREIVRERHGLVLITGGTGTGKSNSLAALVDAVNAERAVHIVTLEDPVEFVHAHKKGVVSQRELHTDFDSFASGLRAALRQAPKVIMVGEIRDRETMEIALQAAGTGHLVLATLHTSDAGTTISRILGLFERHEERLVRMQLAESLRFVISQRLLPRVGGGRIAAFEVLRNTLRVRELVLQGEQGGKSFYEVLEEGGTHGMNTFDQSLFALFEQGFIEENTALLSASDRARLVRLLDRLKSSRGESVSDLRLSGIEEDLDADLR